MNIQLSFWKSTRLMSVLDNVDNRLELDINIRMHFDTSDIFRRYTEKPTEGPIVPEGEENYERIKNALFNGLSYSIIDENRLGFLATILPTNVDESDILNILRRHNIAVFADLLLQRLTIKSRHHPAPDLAYKDFCRFSRSKWQIFFDTFERDVRRDGV